MPATEALLAKLSKDTLGRLAREWIERAETRPGLQRSSEDGDESSDDTDEGEDAAARRKRTLELRYADIEPLSKQKLVERILRDWPHGLSRSQLADADVASFVEKPTKRKWTAHELVYVTPGKTDMTPRELEKRLADGLAPFFAACHVHVVRPYAQESSPFHIRLNLLSPASVVASPAKAGGTVVHILHLPSTPYLLLPSTMAGSVSDVVMQALCTAFSRPPGRRSPESTGGVVDEIRRLKLTGTSWEGLREMLIEGKEGKSGGGWRQFRKEEGEKLPEAEDGEALAPRERRRSVDQERGLDYVTAHEAARISLGDPERKDARDKEVGSVFGRRALPAVELVQFTIPLSDLLGDEAMNGAVLDDDCFRLEVEGAPSVFDGLRSLIDDGLAEAGPRGKGVRCGLPEWMWGAMHGGETVVELEEVVDVGEGEGED